MLPIAQFELHRLLENAANFTPPAIFEPLADTIPLGEIPYAQLPLASQTERTLITSNDLAIRVPSPTYDDKVAPLVSAFNNMTLFDLVAEFDHLSLKKGLFSQSSTKIGGRRRSRKAFTEKALTVLGHIRG